MPCSFLFSFPCWWQSQSNSSNFEFKDRLSDAIITMVTRMKYWFCCCCDLGQVQNTILCIRICGHSNQDLQAPPSQENIHHVEENCWKYFKFSIRWELFSYSGCLGSWEWVDQERKSQGIRNEKYAISIIIIRKSIMMQNKMKELEEKEKSSKSCLANILDLGESGRPSSR